MTEPPNRYQLSARIASGTRWRGADDPQVLDDRAELRTQQVIDHIRGAVAEHPPLRPDQLARIAEMLR